MIELFLISLIILNHFVTNCTRQNNNWCIILKIFFLFFIKLFFCISSKKIFFHFWKQLSLSTSIIFCNMLNVDSIHLLINIIDNVFHVFVHICIVCSRNVISNCRSVQYFLFNFIMNNLWMRCLINLINTMKKINDVNVLFICKFWWNTILMRCVIFYVSV